MFSPESGTSEIIQGNSELDPSSDHNLNDLSQNPVEGLSLEKMKAQLTELNRQLNSGIFEKKDKLPHLEALYKRTTERRDALQAQVTEIEDGPRLEAERIKRKKNQEIAQTILSKVKKDTQFTNRLKNTPEPIPYKSSEDLNFIETELQKIDNIIALYTEIIIERKSLTTGSFKEMEQKIRNYEQTRQAYYEDLIALEEKEMFTDTKSEISHILSTGEMSTELERIILTDETINDLIARGYRPGAGETNVKILLPVIEGKLSVAKEIVQHFFPELEIDQNGEPVINWWGRLRGKDKKIKNHEDYRIFRAIFDLKTHLEAEPTKILPEIKPVAVKTPVKAKRTNPILRYATAAASAAMLSNQEPDSAVQTQTTAEVSTTTQPDIKNENEQLADVSEFIIAPRVEQVSMESEESADTQGRRSLQLASQTEESTSARPRYNLDKNITAEPSVITEKPTPEKKPLKNTLVKVIKDSGFKDMTTSPKTKAQIDSAFVDDEISESNNDDTASIFEQGPARPSMETHLARNTETSTKKLSSKSEKVIITTPPKVSKKIQTALDQAFIGGQKFDRETPDEKRFRTEPKAPGIDTINPPTTLGSETFEEEESTEEAKPSVAELKKTEYLPIPEKFRSTGSSESEAYREALTPAVYDSLFRRLQKLGFSTPEQNKLIDHMVRVTDSMSPELKAKKVSQVLKLDHNGLKRTFKQAFLE